MDVQRATAQDVASFRSQSRREQANLEQHVKKRDVFIQSAFTSLKVRVYCIAHTVCILASMCVVYWVGNVDDVKSPISCPH